MATLLTIPPELQAHIVSFIDQPSDWHSLALTCKQLNRVSDPYLQYATISASLRTNDWQKVAESLKEKSEYAFLVQTVKVCGDSQIPRDASRRYAGMQTDLGVLDPPTLDAETALCEALGRMPNLKTFQVTWMDGPRSEDNIVWQALENYCPKVTSVSIDDELLPPVTLTTRTQHALCLLRTKPFQYLRGLKRFSYKTDMNNFDEFLDQPNQSLRPLMEILTLGCPQLEQLSIIWDRVDHDHLPEHYSRFEAEELLRGRWPRLKRLELWPAQVSGKTASDFFHAHPTLEELILNEMHDFVDMGRLRESSLPNLRAFCGQIDQQIVLLTRKTRLPLMSLAGGNEDYYEATDEGRMNDWSISQYEDAMESYGRSLESFSTCSYNLDAESAALRIEKSELFGLKRYMIQGSSSDQSMNPDAELTADMSEWAEELEICPTLEEVGAMRFVYAQLGASAEHYPLFYEWERANEVVYHLAGALPNLKRIYNGDKFCNTRFILEIVRKDDQAGLRRWFRRDHRYRGGGDEYRWYIPEHSLSAAVRAQQVIQRRLQITTET